MVKNWARPFLPVILLATFSLNGSAQDTKSILNAVAKAMGSENLRTLQYSGSGSTYDEKGQHSVMKSYSRRLDLNAIAADSPWEIQFDFWLTPYGFLKGASTSNATVETKAVGGEDYRIVSFTLPGNHKVSGYINAKNMVEKVETHIDHDVLVQSAFHEYQDFGGIQVPTIMSQTRNGQLRFVLIVKDAKPNS
jgi:hypothetical protein